MKTIRMSLKELPKNARIAIYGSGRRGQDYFKIIGASRQDVHVDCFLDSFVSDSTSSPPIVNIDEFDPTANGVAVILVCSDYSDEIAGKLRDRRLLPHDSVAVYKADWFTEPLTTDESRDCESMFLALKEVLAGEPCVLDALGRLEMARNRPEAARRHFEKAKTAFPKDIWGYVGAASVALMANDPEEAETMYTEIIHAFPDNPAGRLGLARALCAMNRTDAAEREYKRAIERFPDVPAGSVELASFLLEENRLAEAEELYERLMRSYPNTPTGFLGCAKLHQKANRLFDAEKALRSVTARFPHSPSVHVAYARLLMDMSRYNEAQEAFKGIAEAFPGDPVGSLGAAEAYKLSGRLRKAEEAYQNVVAAYPNNPAGHIGLAETLALQNRHREAENLYSEITARFPDEPVGYIGKADLCIEMNRHGEAEAIFRSIAARFPYDARGYLGVAAALASKNQHEEAEAMHLGALEKFPHDLNVHLKYANFLVRMNKHEQSLDVFRSIQRHFPNNEVGYLGYAHALENTNKLDEAAAAFTSASEKFPFSPEGYLMGANVFLLMDQLDKAESFLRPATAHGCATLSVLYMLKVINILQGEFHKAREVLSQIVSMHEPSKRKSGKGVLFDHLHKCGGTTVINYLMRHFKNDVFFNTMSLRVGDGKRLGEYFACLSEEERSAYRLICGRFARHAMPFVGEDMLKATVVRNPLDRALSEYYYARKRHGHTHEVELKDFFENIECVYVNWFSSKEERKTLNGADLVDRCCENLANAYDLVGTTENMSAFLDTLREMADLPFAYAGSRFNVVHKRKKIDEIEPEVVELAKERLDLDMQLYNQVRQRWGNASGE